MAAGAVFALGGCANLGYYASAASGHLKVLGAAKPVRDWLADESTPQRVKDKLALAQRIRAFAVTELHLPDNASYHRYADLGRSAVIWNVVAAPEYSLELKSWCFPVTGCVGYRGHFDEAKARAESAELAQQGYETSVYPVPAYSTLGWLNWAGGDPLLNTFIHYPEGELARLIFHELAHQVLYTRDDTMFNESFAVAVERLGGARWLATHASEQARQEYAEFDARRRQFRALQQKARERLKSVYQQAELPLAERAALKQQAMQAFRDDYQRLRATWPGDAARWRGYDLWVERANNAAFGAQAAYDELVPGFEALFRANGGDWRRFYDAASQLARLPKDERRRQLKTKETPGA
ncbi:MAG: aminopeptidase [Burkholderiales bacterium]|nr:aminopeptidase [Burkholderiales bacterium]